MTVLLLVACALVGMLTFRIRGGLLETIQLRGQIARMSWAASCGLTVNVAAGGLYWWPLIAVTIGAFAAATLPLFHSMDAGHREGTRLGDFGLGLLHGLMMACLIGFPLLWREIAPYPTLAFEPPFPRWWLAPIGGAMWPVVYALAWLRPEWPELRRMRLGRTGEPPEAAELAFGLVFAMFLFGAASP